MNFIKSLLFPGYVIVLLLATHWPAEQLPTLPSSDKSLHFFAYFILGFLALWHVQHFIWQEMDPLKWFVLLLLLALFGAMDELTQPWFNRFADVQDWIADFMGIAFGLIFGRALLRFWPGLIKPNPLNR